MMSDWQDRIDDAIERHIEKMTLDTMVEYIRNDLDDYYWRQAGESEIYEFIEANEEKKDDK